MHHLGVTEGGLGVGGKISDDVLVEIFDACRADNANPNRYPTYWWHKLAHVCQRWRRIVLDSPGRLGLTVICTPRTPVEDMLAGSPGGPAVPIVIYYGNPEPFEAALLDDDLVVPEGVRRVLGDRVRRERVCRINLHLSDRSLRRVFELMMADDDGGHFPVLETLQLYCSSSPSSIQNEDEEDKDAARARLPDSFRAPKLRHVQLSDFSLVRFPSHPHPREGQDGPLPLGLSSSAVFSSSLVSFSIGELAPPVPFWSPKRLVEKCLSAMPRLVSLKIGYLVPVVSGGESSADEEEKEMASTLRLADLEELQFNGESGYFEGLAARIVAPSLNRLSLTFTDDLVDVNLPNLSDLVRGGSADLSDSCRFARVRFKEDLSVAMDRNELWTGRGAFELVMPRYSAREPSELQIKVLALVCGELPALASGVTSLLLEYARSNKRSKYREIWTRASSSSRRASSDGADRKRWRWLLEPFGNVETLRVAGLADEIADAFRPPDPDPDDDGDGGDSGSVRQPLLPKLNKIVLYGGNPENENGFLPFVEARLAVGSRVEVVSGPKHRLTLV